ncbi:unnamed protein product [Allacma fusca]|uniref:RecQ-mediated genome instability protein 2 n=1 Tax=Allacma fusca TaxID=39272 RepID=A0A8J2JWQ6_9HEXA|nr:unnamed protein product [Allacma fusca]
MATSGLNSEAFKLMIADISKAKEVESGIIKVDLSSEDFKKWPKENKICKTIVVKVAWIQGEIVGMRRDSEDQSKLIIIKDGTGEAVIAGWDVIPGGDHEGIKIGEYIAILGQVMALKPAVYMKAVKLMVLNKNPLLKTVWPDEVKDLKGFLLGFYSSWDHSN